MASEMLLDAAVFSPSWATKLRETARPALSSAGEVIFEPEDKRASDCCSAALDWLNSVAVFIAAVFVLTTIPIIYSFRESPRVGPFLLTQHPCCVDGPFYSGTHRFSRWLFVAARSHCLTGYRTD